MASSDQRKPAPLPGTVKLLGWVSFLNDIASEMIYTQLPQFLIQVLGGNKLYLGIIEGTAETVSGLLKLWSGARSDKSTHRKAYVVFGYSLTTISRPVLAFITAPWQLFVLRSLDRIGKGIRVSPRDAIIADSTDKSNRGRAFGFNRGMDHLGAAIGPLLATAFLVAWPGKLREMFLISLVPGIAVTLLVLFLREQNSAPQVADLSSAPAAPMSRDFRVFLAAVLLFTLGNSSDMFLLVRAGEIGIPHYLLPILWCVFHVVKSGGNMLAGGLVDRFGPRPMLVAGWLIYAVVYFLFAFAVAAYQVWILFVLYAIYYALTEPAEKTLVAVLAGPNRKGLAFGWFNLIIGLSALPASALFGWIYQRFGGTAAFGMGSGMAIAAVVVLILFHYEPQGASPGKKIEPGLAPHGSSQASE